MPETSAGIAFRFEGRLITAVSGQSLAAALAAAGELTLGTGRDGSPRGAFCGMGMCHDCLVVVDGRAGQRACMTRARDGLAVERQPPRPDPAATGLRALAEPKPALPERACDVLVVGAGPAGLAAAVAAREAGADIVIVDERPSPGGQYYKQPAALAESRRADAQARAGAALIARARALGVEILGEAAVWGAERRPGGGLAIAALRGGASAILRPRVLVVATGATERAPIFPGWTLPGVMTSGALQTMLRADGAVPRGRVLVAGNGPLNLQVAVEALRRGARVVGVVEAAPAPGLTEGLGILRAGPRLAATGVATLARLRAAGVPVHWGRRIVCVLGEGRAERVRVAPVDGRGDGFEIAAELVALGEGFAPANELPRLLGCRHAADGRDGLRAVRDADGRSSLPDVFVAGEAGRFGGARVAEAEGTLAGRAAARGLGFAVSEDDGALRRALARHERFQAALWQAFSAPHPALVRADDATVVCRCEAVTLGRLRDAVARHAVTDLPSLKRLTRAGMGRCQGRSCVAALATLLDGPAPDERAGFAPQMPLRPVPLAALAKEQPEWGGHRRSLLPAWNPGADAGAREAPRDAEVAVIGAGIAGLSTALFLARAGRDVLVIERSEPNALASGGNAGSLHAQLLSFDHGARAAGAGGPAARTLPLQRDSIALWAALERELGADFEMAVTGGLMVAETERDLDFLRAKTAVERAQGVESAVIGSAALRALEPALSERFLGAALCSAEGKINPLVATQAILAAAEAAGARLLRRAAVTGIARDGHGFRIETARGPVRAGRIVNAAGAFASTVGRMLEADVPVHGAPLQMVVTEPAVPTIRHLVAHADRHLTLKQAGTGAFIIGGGWTAGLDPVHRHPRPLLSSLAGNLWVAQRVLPCLDRLHVVRSWAAMNIDIDGAPILGEDPRVPGLFHAVTSNGYTLGPLVGRITADLVDRGATDRDVRAFSVTRFSEGAA